MTYAVQSGDTLYSIAQRFGTTVETLARVNNISDPGVIFIGQVLTIPEAGTEEPEDNSEAESPVNGNQTSRNQVTRRVRGLLYTLATDKSVYRQGEDVIISLVKTNVTRRNINLSYRTSQRYDFTARRRAEQNEVWRWSRGRSFAQEITNITLRPGRQQSFRVAWDQGDNRGEQVAPGNYTIEGFNVARELRDEGISINVRIRASVEPTPTPTPSPGRNLLVNPGFEDWPRGTSSPEGWRGNNLFRSTTSRTGNYAAELGEIHDESAELSQRVRIEPGRIYELSWWARENIQTGNIGRFVLFVEIIYYNNTGNFVGRTEPRFSQQDIPNNAYQRYSLSTGRVPAGARVADVRFTFEPSGQNTNTVKIDDVILRTLL